MAIDHSRRSLLRVATLSGLGALILPSTALLPGARATTPKLDPPSVALMVNGWLLNSSDR